MTQRFNQVANTDHDGTKLVSVGQTRDGVDEWITPVSLWELDISTNLYMPPGASPNPSMPRVGAYISGDKARSAMGVTPDNTAVFPTPSVGLYVGSSGDIRVTLVDMNDGEHVTFHGLQGGVVYPFSVKKVWQTGTTASGVVALY